jgi:site-specific DNA-methyltransferase (adenine-specific)
MFKEKGRRKSKGDGRMNHKVMFSSLRQDWATPLNIFNELDKEFHFTLDPCCSEKTAKCKKFYTIKEDGLKQSWEGEVVFVNPPFGREQAAWIKKGYEESLKLNTIIVFLIPARTDTRSFHEYLYNKAELRFVKGRIKFENPDSTTPKEKWTAAPFPSMIAILNPKKAEENCEICKDYPKEYWCGKEEKKKEMGCGKMFCYVCDLECKSFNAYCLNCGRTNHYICNKDKLCPNCENKKENME